MAELPATAPPDAPIASVRVYRPGGAPDDNVVTARVAEALREKVAPKSAVDTARGTRIAGILIESRNGVVTLSGTLYEPGLAERALAAALEVPGVGAVVNRLAVAEFQE